MHACTQMCSEPYNAEIYWGISLRRDMLMDVPLIADLDAIRGRQQKLIDDNLNRLNKKRADHNYSVNERVLLRVADPVKMEDRFTGPYRIARIFVNGAIDLELEPTIVRSFSIRKLVPYRGLLKPPEPARMNGTSYINPCWG